jgi:hypothetical protein
MYKLLWTLCAVPFLASSLMAQASTLKGAVMDDSGAIIPGAKIRLSGPSGFSRSIVASADGSYSFAGLAAGDYTVEAQSPGLAQREPAHIAIHAGVQTLNLTLAVAAVKQEVTVEANGGPTVSVDPSNNASSLVLSGKDLEALPDDPDDLQADLQALAGPGAGPNGGAMFVDGFSGGQLPSKDAIREIRINQNPFSPEYDKLGFGRIEILTKPGADKFHGQGFFNFGDDVWNSRNPYSAEKAPFQLKEYGGTFSGPLSKHASFFLNGERREIDNGSIIHAITLDPATLAIVNPYTETVVAPQRRTRISPRVDYQLNANNTLTTRYSYNRNDVRNDGIGDFNLESRGFRQLENEHLVQITETAVLSPSAVNETRFQFYHDALGTLSNNAAPALMVLGSFNGGGSQFGQGVITENDYELQNYTTLTRHTHTLRFGVRLRGSMIDDSSPTNFGGTYTFGGALAPVLDANHQPVIGPDGQPVLTPITSIERYQRTLLFMQLGLPPDRIRALGGGATQFSIVGGQPEVPASLFDVGAFVGDDWRVKPNLTLSLGLRYETQTNIHDWRDLAPRAAVAWAPGARKAGARAKMVIRAGFGIFYTRFPLNNTILAERYNGVVQQQYYVENPDFFPAIPPASLLTALSAPPTVREVYTSIRAPYILQSSAGVERQLPHNTTVSLTYANSHGLHMYRTEAINAPLPSSGAFPLGHPGPVFLMTSDGLYNQNQLIVNVNSRLNRNVSLFGFYALNRANSNTDGTGTVPANPYDWSGEYGPAALDIRHRVFFGGSVAMPWHMRVAPFLIAQTGPPFDITVGHDLYGTTLFNGRPGIVTEPGQFGAIATAYGMLDPNPSPGEPVLPRNYGRGPGSITLNMRLSKTMGFGPERKGGGPPPGMGGPGGPGGGGGPMGGPRAGMRGLFADTPTSRRYNLTISIAARNLLNHVNPGPIIGNITSPLFGQANQVAAGYGAFSENANNRRLELQARFSF